MDRSDAAAADDDLPDEVPSDRAAEYLGVTPGRILQLITEGKLVADKYGSRVHWVSAASLRDYKNNRRPRGRPAGWRSAEPAQSARYGAGERAERLRDYNRDYKRRMKAEAEREAEAATAAKTAKKTPPSTKAKSPAKKPGAKRK